jgi:MFS family permease
MGIRTQPQTRLWRNRGFLLLWSGQLTSQFGTGLLRLAVLLHVFTSTRSTTATTAAFLAETAPGAFLSPWAGALADRLDRRTLLVAADIARALLLLPLLVDTSLGVLLAVLAIQAAVGSVFQPAYGAFVPSVVPPEQLATGNALFTSSGAALSVVAPSIGAALYAGFGFRFIVALDSVTFLASAVTLVLLARWVSDVPVERAARVGLRAELAVATKFIRTTPLLRLLFVVMMAFGVAEALMSPLLVPFLEGTLQATAPQVGVAFTVMSIGSVVGGILMVTVSKWLGATRMFVVGTIGASLAIVAFAMAPSYAVALVIGGVLSVPTQFTSVGSMTLMQIYVPNEIRGRVLGGFSAVFGAVTLVSAAVPAFASTAIGVRGVMLIGAAAACLAAVLSVAGYRGLRTDEPTAVPVMEAVA